MYKITYGIATAALAAFAIIGAACGGSDDKSDPIAERFGVTVTATELARDGCSQDDYDTLRTALLPYIDRWGDALELADSTSRVALAGPIADMQEIRRETAALAVPECGQEAVRLFSTAQDSMIDAFLKFARQDAHQAAINQATADQNTFARALEDAQPN